MTDTLNAEDRRDYLDQPVNDLHKIHGHFSAEAKTRASARLLRAPGKVLLGSLAVAGIVLTRLMRGRKSSQRSAAYGLSRTSDSRSRLYPAQRFCRRPAHPRSVCLRGRRSVAWRILWR